MSTLALAITRFITARSADGRAPRTLADYHRTLDPFTQWMGLNADKEMTRDTVREYVAHLRSLGWRDATAGIYIRNLRAFLRWMHEEGCTDSNLALAVKAPRQVSRLEIPITPEEIQLLLNTCATREFHDRRDRALILLMSDTGLRTGEIVRLKAGDWRREPDNSGSYLLVYAPKTGTPRYAILGRSATETMQVYIEMRGKLEASAVLFCSEDGSALKARAIGSLLARRGAKAGLERCRVHPHIFRKAFVTGSLDNGMDAERVRVLAGWTTMAMFKVYTDSTLSKLRAAHQRAGPVDRMNLRL